MFAGFRTCLHNYEQLLNGIEVLDITEAPIAACLILTGLEQFGAALLLSEQGYTSHAPSHIRSLLEGHINLELLARDPENADQLRYESARKDRTFLREYRASPEIQGAPDIAAQVDAMLANAEQTLTRLEPLNLQARNTLQTFQEAGKAELYLAFRQLSSFVHPSLRALTARHRDDESLIYKRPLPDETVISHLAIGLTLLFMMMERLPEFTNVTIEDLQPANETVTQLLQAVG